MEGAWPQGRSTRRLPLGAGVDEQGFGFLVDAGRIASCGSGALRSGRSGKLERATAASRLGLKVESRAVSHLNPGSLCGHFQVSIME